MKKYIALLFLFPIFAFAGGHQPVVNQCYVPPPIYIPPVIVPPVVVPPIAPLPPPAPPTPQPPTTPTMPQVPSSGGGGGMIYCSGPLAPGWHTDIPGGGCNTNICTPITDFKVENWVKGDGKVQLLWQGSGYVNVWKKEKGIISHYYIKSSGFYEVKTQGADFWISNACSQTPRIDP